MTDTKNDEKIDDQILDKIERFDSTFKVAKLCGISCRIFEAKTHLNNDNLSHEEKKCLGSHFILFF